jgi:hypothetical protein
MIPAQAWKDDGIFSRETTQNVSPQPVTQQGQPLYNQEGKVIAYNNNGQIVAAN